MKGKTLKAFVLKKTTYICVCLCVYVYFQAVYFLFFPIGCYRRMSEIQSPFMKDIHSAVILKQ